MPIFRITKDSEGYQVKFIPLGLSAGSLDNGERFSTVDDLRADLIERRHTGPQIETILAALDRNGEANSKVED